MAVLVFAESIDGKFHKPVFEALTWAADTAKQMNTDVAAVVAGSASGEELQKLAKYGAGNILHAADDRLNAFGVNAYTTVLQQAIAQSNANVVVMSSTFNAKSLAPR